MADCWSIWLLSRAASINTAFTLCLSRQKNRPLVRGQVVSLFKKETMIHLCLCLLWSSDWQSNSRALPECLSLTVGDLTCRELAFTFQLRLVQNVLCRDLTRARIQLRLINKERSYKCVVGLNGLPSVTQTCLPAHYPGVNKGSKHCQDSLLCSADNTITPELCWLYIRHMDPFCWHQHINKTLRLFLPLYLTDDITSESLVSNNIYILTIHLKHSARAVPDRLWKDHTIKLTCHV